MKILVNDKFNFEPIMNLQNHFFYAMAQIFFIMKF